ncbi:MAG: ATP-binding protein [Methanobrevibacter sp.]|nr:ATP-binding protein [Methanobrevibacter sp.]
MKKLPKGISTFQEIIEDNYVYVDKTKYIHKVINTGKLYFLSRPRRFGKSLLISTLEELFKGKKELFKGLYIYDKWDWTKKYPIIRLDFGKIAHKNPETLENSLDDFINQKARDNSINLISKTLTSKFAELIEEIHKKFKSKVVILIDEYDKAISSHIDDIEIAKENKTILRDFYQVLKSCDKHIHFLFIAGIAKFAKTSIFSDLNNVDDITIHPKYVNICGYKQNDLESYFKDYINEISIEINMDYDDLISSIKKWYNGYSWDGKNFLYNPFSILKFLDTGKFANYWFDTGTPKMLIDLIKKDSVDIEVLTRKKSKFLGIFPNFELENLDFSTVLLQTGYLTIKKETISPGEQSEYTMAIPNKEVEESLFSYIIGNYTNYSAEKIEPMTRNMLNYIIQLDEENLQKSFEILLYKIPNLIYGEIKHELEAYYKILFISWIQLLGFDIEGEIMSIKGRLDAILKHNDLVLIIEFKFSKDKSFDEMLKEAEKQIIDKEYYKPYQDKNVLILAVAFKPKDVKCQLKTLKDVLI